MFNGHVFGDIHRERGFAHGGSASHNHQVATLQPRGHSVKIRKPRGYTSDISVALTVIQLIDFIDHFR